MINFKLGDEVRLIQLGSNHKFLGGFEIGLTGKIIDFVNREYPIIRWNKPVKCKNGIIKTSDVHCSKLEILS